MYKNIFYDKLTKIELRKNNKEPATTWSLDCNRKKIVNMQRFNCGILTGKINNIVVLDVDEKDDGVIEFNKYIEKYNKPNTFTVKSPNNGYHYYFKYTNSNESVQHLINNSLTNSSKYRNGKGIDIRTDGGYIVSPGSSLNNKFYTVINDVPIIELSEELALWILEFKNQKQKNNKKNKQSQTVKKSKNKKLSNSFTNPYIYNVTDEEIKIFLNKLDKSYYEDYDKWLVVLTVLKNLNKFDIFDEFSKKSVKYNYKENLIYWNHNSGRIDINYLIIRHNKETKFSDPIKIVDRYKNVDDKPNLSNIETLEIEEKYVKFNKNIFDSHNTIFIQSDPGTGKTTFVAKHIQKYIGQGFQFITLVNKIKLGDQQFKSFNDNHVKLVSYQDPNKNICEDNLLICVNSLLILKNIPPSFFENTVLFLDEIDDFIHNLTHNKHLDMNIKIIYDILINMIKKCYKVIVSDDYINQNSINLFDLRKNKNKIFIINKFKKFQDISAVDVKDKNMFVNKIFSQIESNKYFLFGCDSCTVVTDIYYKCIEKYKTKKDNFILITSNTKFQITDASTQFKNKFVFYSPSITTGIDFSIDIKQNQFIYVKGDTINPRCIFQQACRNRNIDTLYYYFEPKSHDFIYNSLKDVTEHYSNILNSSIKINQVCKQFDKYEDAYINHNTYFNLFCFSEYINDSYNTNKKIHFQNILKNKGFLITSLETKPVPEIKNNNKFICKNINKEIVDKYIELLENNKSVCHDEFQFIHDNIELLNLQTLQNIIQYKSLIYDKNELNHYFNFIKLIQKPDKNIKNISLTAKSSFLIKQYGSVNLKVYMIRNLYKTHKIPYLSLDKFDTIKQIKISHEELKLINDIFRLNQKLPPSSYDFSKFIVLLINNLISNLKIISKKKTKNSFRNEITVYKYEQYIISHYYSLFKNSSPFNFSVIDNNIKSFIL